MSTRLRAPAGPMKHRPALRVSRNVATRWRAQPAESDEHVGAGGVLERLGHRLRLARLEQRTPGERRTDDLEYLSNRANQGTASTAPRQRDAATADGTKSSSSRAAGSSGRIQPAPANSAVQMTSSCSTSGSGARALSHCT